MKYRDENMSPQDLRMSDVTYYKIAEYQKEPEVEEGMKSEDVFLVASHRENALARILYRACRSPRGRRG